VRVTPVGQGGHQWARQLTAMYAAWAERTSRDATTGANGRHEVRIDGLATFDLLAGETGLHRHVRPDRSEALARVTVSSPRTEPRDDDAPAVVVRVYEEGKRRVVRDPRTGARHSHVAEVLEEGMIDPFLIAWLHRA
jgi:hypothetical protein